MKAVLPSSVPITSSVPTISPMALWKAIAGDLLSNVINTEIFEGDKKKIPNKQNPSTLSNNLSSAGPLELYVCC